MPQARSSGSKSALFGPQYHQALDRGQVRGREADHPQDRECRDVREQASRHQIHIVALDERPPREREREAAAEADPRLEAVAQRVRKLNERIIEEGKAAGEATLTSYEKALKAIASTLERGPGKSDVEWISSLATTQAKFLRDVTTAWTAAARGMLK